MWPAFFYYHRSIGNTKIDSGMKPHYSFDYIAEKHGIPIERFPYLKKVYTDYSHDVTLLRNKLMELKLSKIEMQMILTFHGGVIAGRATL
jgi:hypothetical protein